MNSQREFATANLLPDGTVLVAGGAGVSSVLASAELFDPQEGVFTELGSSSSMGVARDYATATSVAGGKVLVAGGDSTSGFLASAEVFDPVSGSFSPTTGSLTAAREAAGATALADGKALVVGGYGNSGFLTSANVYDPATGNFTATGNLGVAREVPLTVLLESGKVFVAGGWSTLGSLSGAELYDPASGRFSPTGSMVAKRAWGTATRLADGKVLVAGGWGPSGGSGGYRSLASAEVYDPNGTPMPAVTWAVANGQRTVTATIVRLPATTYTLTAKKGSTTKTGRCTVWSAKVVCTLRPGAGNWRFAVTPRADGVAGVATTKPFSLRS